VDGLPWGILSDRLQNSGRFEVGEHLDDVFGHRGRSGQVVAGGLESVFIGHPIDGEHDAIRSRERVRSLGHGADILGFGADLFLAATFRHFGAIGRLETDFNFWGNKIRS
jgi:hypothetical protein